MMVICLSFIVIANAVSFLWLTEMVIAMNTVVKIDIDNSTSFRAIISNAWPFHVNQHSVTFEAKSVNTVSLLLNCM